MGKFAEDAYRNAVKDRKKSIIYDNLCKLVIASYQLTVYIYLKRTNLILSVLKKAIKSRKLWLHLSREEEICRTIKKHTENIRLLKHKVSTKT